MVIHLPSTLKCPQSPALLEKPGENSVKHIDNKRQYEQRKTSHCANPVNLVFTLID